MLDSIHPHASTQILSQPTAIPQTKGWPLLGSLPHLLKNPFKFMVQAREQYGDIYRLNLGVTNVVVLNHPSHAQTVLRDRADHFRKGGVMWDMVRHLLGNGLVVSEGDFWLRQRRMMQPQFHRQRLAALTEMMVTAIDEAYAGWQHAAAPNQPFNMAQGFNHLTMRVIVRTLFGTALSRDEMETVAAAMTFALDYLMTGILFSSLPEWAPVPGKKRFQKAIADFDKILYRIIAQCRAGEGEQNHLLQMLLDTVDDETGEQMSDQQLRDEIATLFLAGYETTSIALTWTFAYLAQNPDVMAKLQAEVDEVLQGRQPTLADLMKMPYTRMVFQETMRLRPPSWWLPREVTTDEEIDGYHLPAGTQVVSLTYMYHRHPEHWPNPEQFDPERFNEEKSAKRHRYAWVPFGAGQRLCIGRDFAMMEGQLALAMAVQRFQVQAVKEEMPQPVLSSTLRPKGGFPVHLTPRA